LTSAPRDAKSAVVPASRYAASGGLPPAIWVVSFCDAPSAGMFTNLTLMLGCSAWNFL
jgi:hypothetical protein